MAGVVQATNVGVTTTLSIATPWELALDRLKPQRKNTLPLTARFRLVIVADFVKVRGDPNVKEEAAVGNSLVAVLPALKAVQVVPSNE